MVLTTSIFLSRVFPESFTCFSISAQVNIGLLESDVPQLFTGKAMFLLSSLTVVHVFSSGARFKLCRWNSHLGQQEDAQYLFQVVVDSVKQRMQ